MPKVNFTSARVGAHQCLPGKSQSFIWDSKAPGLGLRATPNGAKAYIFQAKIHGQTVRLTIGDPRAWDIHAAQEEARRLQTLVDSGIDPREHAAQQRIEYEARKAEAKRQEVIFEEAWLEYLEERKPLWSDRTYTDHVKAAERGGQPRKRGKGCTMPGPIAVLLPEPLSNLSSNRLIDWLNVETETRPTYARNAFRKLRAFVNWLEDSPKYRGIVHPRACETKAVKQVVPKANVKEGDCLQREQLSAWFREVRSLRNPVQSAYLQGLLLAGPRREELAALRWVDIDFTWKTMILNDKVEGTGGRTVPLPPYLAAVLLDLKRINEMPPTKREIRRLAARGQTWAPSPWVFFSKTSADGNIAEPRIAHNKALARAQLPHLTIHGLRRSFGTLSEWCDVPVGVVAQIQGHKPSALAEKYYRRRPIDLLRMWHEKIEAWLLIEAGISK